MMVLRLVIYTLMTIVAIAVHGQERPLSLKTFDQNNGIPGTRITCMTKGPMGLLWLGTREGVYRFDGKSCAAYTREGTPLGDINVAWLYCDSRGWMWVATIAHGLIAIDLVRDTVLQYRPGSDPHALPSDRVKLVFEDTKGQIWVATHITGLNLLDRQTHTFINLRPSMQFPSVTDLRDIDEFTCAAQDPVDDNRVWLGSLYGMLSLDVRTKQFTLHRCTAENTLTAEQFNGFENKIRDIHHDGKHLWTASYGGGLTRYDPGTGHFETFKFETAHPPTTSHNNLKRIDTLANGTLLLLPFNHPMMTFDKGEKKFRRLSSPTAYMSFQETEGHIWLSENAPVLHLYNPGAQCIRKVDLDQDIGLAINQPGTDTVFAASWENGLYLVDEGTHQKRFVSYDPLVYTGLNRLKGMHFPSQGDPMLMGSYDLYSLNRRQHRITMQLDLTPDEHGFLSVLWSSDHVLWLGNKGSGLYRVNLLSGEERILTRADGLVHDSWINDLYLDHDGLIWYATEQGFGAVNQQGRPMYSYPYDPASQNDDSGPLKDISAITQDRFGRIWVADSNQGVAVLERSDGAFTEIRRINMSSGLLSSRIRDMVTDPHGDIWLTTDKGISRVFAADFTLENYGTEYGLSRVFDLSVGANGQVYVGGKAGYFSIDPSSAKPVEEPLQVVLQSLSIYDRPYRGDTSVAHLQNLILRHRDGFFTIGFTAPNFFDERPIEYQYKMLGLQDDWVSNGDRQYVGFTKLAGGDYTFMVRARPGQGQWSEPRILDVRIIPAFWQTGWFFLGIALIVAGAIYAFYRYRLGQVRREEQLKASFDKKLAETEMSALRAQMNPHFLFNCLNSIKLFVIENDIDRASKFLTKFSRLIRLILQNSKASKVRLADEIEALRLYIEMEAMRFEEQFAFDIRTNGVPLEDLEVPPLILQPYVENAIWHGLMPKEGRGHLIVTLHLSNGFLLCRIEDDGIGITASRQLQKESSGRRKSYGMSITRDRLTLIQKLYDVDAKIDVEDLTQNGHAAGTRVTVRIPLISGYT